MRIDMVPNRGSTPAVLLRESYREGAKVRKRTPANLSSLAPAQIAAIRAALRGETTAPQGRVFDRITALKSGAIGPGGSARSPARLV